MKRLIKIAVLAFIVAQIPFAVSLWRTQRLHRYLESLPRESNPPVPFRDVRGVIHVHSAQGGHSLGTYQEILAAAKATGCQFVLITEHPGHPPLLRPISDPDILLIYGLEERRAANEILTTADGALRLQTGEAIRIAGDVAGVELFNLHESAQANDTWFNRTSFLYHRLAHPELFFFKIWELDRRRLAAWDMELRSRPITGVAGADAHQNIGLIIETAAGQKIFSLMVDPYAESFRAVSTHLMLPAGGGPVTEQAVISALRQGAAYIAFEKIADSRGFSFHALVAGQAVGMGGTVAQGATLVCQAPRRSVFHALCNGQLWKTATGGRMTATAANPGIYRVELYPADAPPDLAGKPWIMSNPIFVR